MQLKELRRLELLPLADMHVHLRQGEMMELIVPEIRRGGADTVFVVRSWWLSAAKHSPLRGWPSNVDQMPNLQPPLTTIAQVMDYRAQLQALDPNVRYLMSLYLHHSITPQVIDEAAARGIAGVKVYPQGVTTNSAAGITSYEAFFPVFAAMERNDLVLNLHGEVPSGTDHDITALNAEPRFLPTLMDLNRRFPNLRIVLEHCSTAAAVEAVRECGPTVAGSITAHHLYLTVDDSLNDPFSLCRPVPKTPGDRDALLRAVCSGDPKFFFGSDSAPHPIDAKRGGADGKGKTAAGVYTQSFAVPYFLMALEEAIERGTLNEQDVTQERLEKFLSGFGRRFYRLDETSRANGIVLEKKGEKIPDSIKNEDGSIEVALTRAGTEIYSLSWV